MRKVIIPPVVNDPEALARTLFNVKRPKKIIESRKKDEKDSSETQSTNEE